MNASLWIAILAGAVALATPLIVAGLGETLVERAGRLNLGIEGMMAMGAFTAVWTASASGPWAGLAAAIAVGVLMALVMNVAVYRFGANEVVVGLAMTILGLGLSTYLYLMWIPAGEVNRSVDVLPRIELGPLADLPVLGQVLFDHDLIVYLMVPVVLGFWWVMTRTTIGLRIHASGVDPESAQLRGVPVRKVRARVLLVGGAMAGLAGGIITAGDIGSFTPGITAGRGYVVLAVVIMGRLTPLGVTAGSLLFAFFESFALLGQGLGFTVPSEVYSTLPYVVTLVVLVVSSRTQLRALASSA
ncbi:ABC transporter permease [Demequina capsici]|uniref:ABC transporter permease n=1 Tax=Demequina capsici TaxID=3075620 RepID=A0AA96JE55_9MICO|nr:ABC transporter permease [Demequina sp. OYTSA14]WNM25304.1 ABC transporter permease [Demequina sp. OYTSA14]